MTDTAEDTPERVLCWLRDKCDEADESYEETQGPAHFYWLGKWAAYGKVLDLIEKGE